MSAISRRVFIRSAVASAAATGFLMANTEKAAATPLGFPIGSQTWPLRSMLGDFPAFAKSIAGIGVAHLELCSPIGYGDEFASLANAKDVKTILADHGLACESAHFTLDELRNSHEQSMDWAREIGVVQVIAATLGDGNGGDNPTMDQVKQAADEYNGIAAATAKAGMQQGLHNEGFEHAMVAGQRVYDLLFGLLDPALVKFQFQMSSLTEGLVAAEYFTKFPGRFYSIHLQDIDMDTAVAPREQGRPGRRPQVALGEGSIDWVKTFEAAKTGGVKNYFVEQSWELTQRSVAYLKTLDV